MPKTKRPVMALLYDFDGTLSPGNMQEYGFIKQLGMEPKEFWAESRKRALEQKADGILSYMMLMLEYARLRYVKITRESFRECGHGIEYFPGVDTWFSRIKAYGKEKGVEIEHYIVSSGIREILEGTSIYKEFEQVFACSFAYDQHDVAQWPAVSVNYTAKTQFIFRINKGALDITNDTSVNAYMDKDERPIPFERMIYFGDGDTDIPCMKLVKKSGGHSIAVYRPRDGKKKAAVAQLLQEDRVNFIAPADYREGKTLDEQVKAVIHKVAADYEIYKLHKESQKY